MVMSHADLPLVVSRVTPVDLLESYSSKTGAFNPPVQAPAPLHAANVDANLLKLKPKTLAPSLSEWKERVDMHPLAEDLITFDMQSDFKCKFLHDRISELYRLRHIIHSIPQ